ncbi:MAG: DUF6249 domain-containing protein [Paludibacter sp.]|nr:DUF6249 domain-containing protein [Paludibacter sp.]
MKRIGLFLLALTLLVGAKAAEKGINMDSLKQTIVANSKEIQEQKKDSIMFSKLSASQIMELKKGEQEIEERRVSNDDRSAMPLNGVGIVLICALPFLFAGTVIVVNVRNKKEESRRRYELYTKSLEMGQTVPEHFFDEPKKENPASNLKKGILWLVIGLGVLISFIVMSHKEALIVGIVPTFVGVGYLLVHFLEKPKTDSTINNNEQHG